MIARYESTYRICFLYVLLFFKPATHNTKAFIGLILYIGQLNLTDLDRSDWEVIEYFAGARRLCKLAHALGCKSVAMDKKYDDGDNRTKNNSMDINTSTGFVQLSSKKILFGFESGISH